MENEKFGPHLLTILNGDRINEIYELSGINYEVEISLPKPGETLENLRPGLCGAYKSHFKDGLLSFSMPSFLLEALEELGDGLHPDVPQFWEILFNSVSSSQRGWSRVWFERAETAWYPKTQRGFPGMMIFPLCAGRTVDDGIPSRDDRWREKLFVFKVTPASVGDFDFSRLPRGMK
ncbi:Uncharacterized protein Rs2_29000 [Raphanus sativus]|nr:Uncharacterized protein Rs2_29000 [Raphanus sativus]